MIVAAEPGVHAGTPSMWCGRRRGGNLVGGSIVFRVAGISVGHACRWLNHAMRHWLALISSGCFIATLLGVAFVSWHRAELREVTAGLCSENLKRLAIALHQYCEKYGTFPPAYVNNRDGKPMHSWRVLILPYLEHQELYDQYDFAQPWDSPRNRMLAESHPEICKEFQCPCDPGGRYGWTSYVAVVGPNTLWPGTRCLSKDEIQKNANRILLIERKESGVSWMEPKDIDFDEAVHANTALSPHFGFLHLVLGTGDWGKLEDMQITFRNRATSLMSEWASRQRAIPREPHEHLDFNK